MVMTIYVRLFFTLPWFLLVKLWENKLDEKIFSKNGKRMKMVQNYGILGVQELLFRLLYRLFGSLMPYP